MKENPPLTGSFTYGTIIDKKGRIVAPSQVAQRNKLLELEKEQKKQYEKSLSTAQKLEFKKKTEEEEAFNRISDKTRELEQKMSFNKATEQDGKFALDLIDNYLREYKNSKNANKNVKDLEGQINNIISKYNNLNDLTKEDFLEKTYFHKGQAWANNKNIWGLLEEAGGAVSGLATSILGAAVGAKNLLLSKGKTADSYYKERKELYDLGKDYFKEIYNTVDKEHKKAVQDYKNSGNREQNYGPEGFSISSPELVKLKALEEQKNKYKDALEGNYNSFRAGLGEGLIKYADVIGISDRTQLAASTLSGDNDNELAKTAALTNFTQSKLDEISSDRNTGYGLGQTLGFMGEIVLGGGAVNLATIGSKMPSLGSHTAINTVARLGESAIARNAVDKSLKGVLKTAVKNVPKDLGKVTTMNSTYGKAWEYMSDSNTQAYLTPEGEIKTLVGNDNVEKEFNDIQSLLDVNQSKQQSLEKSFNEGQISQENYLKSLDQLLQQEAQYGQILETLDNKKKDVGALDALGYGITDNFKELTAEKLGGYLDNTGLIKGINKAFGWSGKKLKNGVRNVLL